MPNSSFFDTDYSNAFSGGKYSSTKFDNPWFGEGSKPLSNDWNSASSYSKNAFTDPYDFSKTKNEQDDNNTWGKVSKGLRMAGEIFNQRNNPYGSGQNSSGYGNNGGSQQMFDNFGIYTPPTMQPFSVGGESGGKSGLGSAIGTVAGGIAGSFIPGIGTVAGAGLGGQLGGGIGSMFG